MLRVNAPNPSSVLLSLTLVSSIAMPLRSTGGPVSLVDALNGAQDTTSFDMSISGGTPMSPNQEIGPRFTLTDRTKITHIGGFINRNDFASYPILVQIRPSSGGVPDSQVVLGSFALSDDDDLLRFRYEFVEPALILDPGTYFALFACGPGDWATLLSNVATSPHYWAGNITVGCLGQCGAPLESLPGAVRILGDTSETPTRQTSWGALKSLYR
jgi:hypothetical protein